MRRRTRAGGYPIKARRRKTATLKRRNAPKAALSRGSPTAVKETKVARLTRELQEALAQQTATSDVLQVISSSPGDLQPVFESMLANAAKLCAAAYGTMWLGDGDGFRAVAIYGDLPSAFSELRRSGTVFRPRPGVPLARVVATRQPLQIDDFRLDQSYIDREALPVATVEIAGVRTLLSVPMLKADQVIGAIAIFRKQVCPFTNNQIALVQNFAAQAVIAIENTRLINELRERTGELERSYRLVQQQASQLEAQSQELVKLNQELEQRVAAQVGEIERLGRLRRFLPPQVADLIVSSGSEKELESHRREIAALFCDLRGFTGFSESSDPEDVMALLHEYHAAIGRIIFDHGGTLERFAGDGVMAIFNDPVRMPNPALQAVQMALDVRSVIGTLMEKWSLLGHDLGFGIGISHGFATLGTIGFEGRYDYAAIGTVSNVASRLCDEAKPGQILISPRVLMATQDAITVDSIGEFTLKGIRRPIAAYNVLAAKSAN
jgi:class 3 adenylate cyclase